MENCGRSFRKYLKWLLIATGGCILLVLIILMFHVRDGKTSTSTDMEKGHYRAVMLSDKDGKYQTYAIYNTLGTSNDWEYLTPQWYPSKSRNTFFWCNHAYDFIVLTSDMGLFLYVYDEQLGTWSNACYLDTEIDHDWTTLYYGRMDTFGVSDKIGDYSIEWLPTEVIKYLDALF